MTANERAVDAVAETCAALIAGDATRAAEVIRIKYPHVKPFKRRKIFTRREQIALFMRDGFVDRYSGERLIFPGVLCILSATLPEVFPCQANWKTDETHQAWWDLFPSIDHIVLLAFGGTNDDDNLVCTWDGLTAWFMNYVDNNHALLLNKDINNWYRALKNFLED